MCANICANFGRASYSFLTLRPRIPHATRAQHLERWHLVRKELLGRTVEIQELLQRLEAHFPAEPRLLRGMDRESYAKEVFEDLQRDRDAKVQAMIDRQGLPKPGAPAY